MPYTNIQPPFSFRFRELSKSDLRFYYQWFMDVLPERIKILELAVRETEEFEDWSADYSINSLKKLGEWFYKQVETRSRTEEEINEIKSRLKYQFEFSKVELTNRTYSIAFDIGMYFSMVVLKNNKGIEWKQETRKTSDYGHAVLYGTHKVPLNAVNICVVLAWSFVDNSRKPERLSELYDIWVKILMSPTPKT